MYKYLVTYKQDYNNNLYYDVITCNSTKTWRELQEIFDPNYHYNNLKFYNLGSEIRFTG
jgi:hypothetical protein